MNVGRAFSLPHFAAVFPLRVVAFARVISTAENAETAEFSSQILRFSARFARFAVKWERQHASTGKPAQH